MTTKDTLMAEDTPEEDQQVLHHWNGSELGIKFARIKPQTTTAGIKPPRHPLRTIAIGTTAEPTRTYAEISHLETLGKGHPKGIKGGRKTATMRGKFSMRGREPNKTGMPCINYVMW